jgi:AcrR family transcriptional regulator
MPRPANPRVRAALLEAGERLIHERGYNGAGVKEIVDAAGPRRARGARRPRRRCTASASSPPRW